MKSSDIRKAFLDYFAEKGHNVVRSSSLIPRNDPTLLFTNAGMVQFKSVFLGEEKLDYRRAATSQKCMRAGGKHNDLENVGHTKRHHTFFEMLGNFSFGDYFKREAIDFGWELLTKRFGLPVDKLWVTIYEEDDEAEKLWQEVAGVAPDRIVRMGAKDNFWQMADTGPCGPCSEIHIDQGADAGCGRPECRLGCECDRFLELWNLVFMQFNRDSHGTLTPLPSPSIDTGMGLERISAVLQDKQNNFDSDLFSGIIESICSHTGATYGKDKDTNVSIRVIADHARAAAFLLSDGLLPANDGRGYVLRRVIRRASRHARLLGMDKPVLYKIIGSVVSSMGDVYPELVTEHERASRVLRLEEERFDRTLEQGMRILDDVLARMRQAGEKVIPGDEIFKLYDTFGFPVDLVRDIALDSGLSVDEEGFSGAMKEQRERARASWVGQDEAIAAVYREVLIEAGESEFLGYRATEADAVVKALIKEGVVTEEASEGQEAEVVLDRTPFYGESGGQVGDTGVMTGEGGLVLRVIDTKRPLEGLIVHKVKVEKGPLSVWAKVNARVDEERRRDIMRNHTATHLLQAALRGVLGDHVKQAGSLVAPGRLRFDFTHFSSVTEEELREIEDQVNARVLDNAQVGAEELSAKEAIEGGATALFGEKYGDTVRVISVPGFSKELCGGTHCTATGQIGSFVIDSEGSVASGIRRIEAMTGRGALDKIRMDEEELKTISSMLKVSDKKPSERLGQLMEELKTLEKEKLKLQGAAMKDMSGSLMEKAKEIDGVKVLSARVDGIEQKDLRDLADKVRDKLGSGIVVLGSALEGNAVILANTTRDLSKKYPAGKILSAVAEAAGGRGGGKPEMAQGGTKDISKLDSALESVYDIVRGM